MSPFPGRVQDGQVIVNDDHVGDAAGVIFLLAVARVRFKARMMTRSEIDRAWLEQGQLRVCERIGLKSAENGVREAQTLDSPLFAPIRSPDSVLRNRFFHSLSARAAESETV